jgi:sterol desaturase/sphingolipid hydroxylase (fatty acid hydroxylase superfamily)
VATFYIAIAGIFAFNTALLTFLSWAYYSPRFTERRISAKPGIKVPWPARLRTMAVISTLSLAIVLGGTYFGFAYLVSAEASSWWVIALQASGILVAYDFAYYFLHRTLHHKKLMRFVHGVHHRARNPSALESFYLHPIELCLGLGLLLVCSAAIGPVHPAAFLIAFFVYSNLNIIIHAGVELPGLLLKPTSFLTRKHHVHHQDDFNKNYSSLTPLPDLIFRTAG